VDRGWELRSRATIVERAGDARDVLPLSRCRVLSLAGKTKYENVACVSRRDERDAGTRARGRECRRAVPDQVCVLDDADRARGERIVGQNV